MTEKKKRKQYLRRADVAEHYHITIRTVIRMEEDGRLPKPIYLGRVPLHDEDQLEKLERAAFTAA
jgi:hypothetical protein